MRWLVTGGCGFIGRHLVLRLLGMGHQIRVVDNESTSTFAELSAFVAKNAAAGMLAVDCCGGNQLECVSTDIRDEAAAARVSADVEVIVHLAAMTGVASSLGDPRADCETNVLGTLNYLEAAKARGVRRFIFASSGAPIGNVDPPIHEGIAPRPQSPYGASKLAGEGYCSAYYASFGIRAVALRFSNVYGPESQHKSSVVARFIREALTCQSIAIFGDGNQSRDFLFVSDVVTAIVAAAAADRVGGETIHLATERETTIATLAEMLLGILEMHGVRGIAVRHTDALAGEVRRSFADTSKARELLRWRPRVALEDGLDSTVRWFLTPHIASSAEPSS